MALGVFLAVRSFVAAWRLTVANTGVPDRPISSVALER